MIYNIFIYLVKMYGSELHFDRVGEPNLQNGSVSIKF